MRSIARVLLEQGRRVSGSDVAESDAIAALRKLGATVSIGHRADQLNGAQMVVVSTAIVADNPEWVAAQKQGIPVIHRSEMWAHILNRGQGIAVAGAHGKTTITSLIAWVLHQAGYDPTFLIGGEIPGLGAARYGQGAVVVAEADESDASFVRYHPWCSIVTSMEADHMEFYEGKLERLIHTYHQFLGNTRPDGFAVLCTDDVRIRQEIPKLNCRYITYGLESGALWRATDIQLHAFQSNFQVESDGRVLGRIQLAIPGVHNVQNALAVVVACTEAGLEFSQVAKHLATFSGTQRRFEPLFNAQGILVIDDYAHHPSEIRATLQAARRGWPASRLIAVFQPHRYSRTEALFGEFVSAFGDADMAVVTGIYSPPPEQPIPGISSERLVKEIQAHSPHVDVAFAPHVCAVADQLTEQLGPGDIVVTMGAGDIWRAAREIAQRLEAR